MGDTIEAGGGNDTVIVVDALGGTGADDVVDAGAGEDTVYADDGRADTITCGTGFHRETTTVNGNPVTVLQAPDVDRVRADQIDSVRECERAI